jgi:long-subunit fatty acid transport protein
MSSFRTLDCRARRFVVRWGYSPRFTLTLCLTILFLVAGGRQSQAEDVAFSSSMNPVGSGARAAGMGGAFIAVADDATAASWNPAGLINLEKPEISLVYSYFNRSQSYHSSTHPEMSGTPSEMDAHDVNFASLAIPFHLLDRNMIITLNYQQLYDMNKDVHFNFNFDPGNVDGLTGQFRFTQQGSIGAFSPAFAIQVLPELYFGATVNIWDGIGGTSAWQNKSSFSGTGTIRIPEFSLVMPFNTDFSETQKFSFKGLNANLGLLYTLGGKYSVGFVYKTPFDASVIKETTTSTSTSTPDSPPDPPLVTNTTENLIYSMPASYGIGFAYRHSDRLTLSLDIYRTEWSDFAITNKATGERKNPLSNQPIGKGKPKDTTQVRMGAEYLIIGNKTVIPLRAGLFYDPEPGMRKTGDQTTGSPVDDSTWSSKINDFYGFSVGSGIAIDSWAFDFSYQYRFGNRVSSDITIQNINMDTTQHTVLTSLIYHF